MRILLLILLLFAGCEKQSVKESIAEDNSFSTNNLYICWDGGEVCFNFDEDELKLTGDTDKMNEPAKIFFTELIKPMVDDYIKERLAEN